MICKRCGDEGHSAKSCQMPPLDRPDIERMTEQQRAGRVKRISYHTVEAMVAYIERLEASRRQAITELQRRMSLTHNTGMEL